MCIWTGAFSNGGDPRSGGAWVSTRDPWSEQDHRMPSNHTKEVTFSSPVSGPMALAFHEGHSPEAHKLGTTHTCPLTWNLQRNPHYGHWCNIKAGPQLSNTGPGLEAFSISEAWFSPGDKTRLAQHISEEGGLGGEWRGRKTDGLVLSGSHSCWAAGERGAGASRRSMPAAGAARNTAAHSCPLTNWSSLQSNFLIYTWIQLCF